MNKLVEKFDPACVKLELDSRKKKDVIKELIELLDATGKVKDTERLFHQLMEREKLSSTGVGHGIALPHRLSATVDKTTIACGLSRKGIDFGAVDRKRVHLVFLIVGPLSAPREHLVILSKLSRLLNDSDFRDRLLSAKTPEELIEQFGN